MHKKTEQTAAAASAASTETLIDIDGDELKELGLKVEELENKSGEEFEVAALPLLALLLAGFCLGIAAGSVIAQNRAGDIVA